MDKITFYIAMGIRGSIAEGEYTVGEAKIGISYPAQINLGFPTPIDLPKSLSTLFMVSWEDEDGEIAAQLSRKKCSKRVPLHYAIDKINEIILAFKLVNIGNIDGIGLRTVGVGDTLFYYPKINDQLIGHFNMGMKINRRDYPWAFPQAHNPYDMHGATQKAQPHIASGTYNIARRYVRCYELLEYGFYTEAFIVAFSILDDLVQQMLHQLLEDKGMVSYQERKGLIRGIKENRLKIFLGPLLKVLTGKDLPSMWPGSDKALNWLNETRNKLAHAGEKADYAIAAWGIFACIKMLIVLNQNQLMEADFPVEFFRHAKVTAAHTENAPEWVPSGKLAESINFES